MGGGGGACVGHAGALWLQKGRPCLSVSRERRRGRDKGWDADAAAMEGRDAAAGARGQARVLPMLALAKGPHIHRKKKTNRKQTSKQTNKQVRRTREPARAPLVLFSDLIFNKWRRIVSRIKDHPSAIPQPLPPTLPPSLPRPRPHTGPPPKRRFSTHLRHTSIGKAGEALQACHTNPALIMPAALFEPQRPPLLSPRRRTSSPLAEASERRCCCLLLWRAFSLSLSLSSVRGPQGKERGRREARQE